MKATRIDSRDVLDPNVRVRTAFEGRIVGFYARKGPNVWDDYVYVPQNGSVIEVKVGLNVQLEPDTAHIRMRRKGNVVVVEWLPRSDEVREMTKGNLDRRDFFAARYLIDFANPPGWGLAAVIAKKLKEK